MDDNYNIYSYDTYVNQEYTITVQTCEHQTKPNLSTRLLCMFNLRALLLLSTEELCELSKVLPFVSVLISTLRVPTSNTSLKVLSSLSGSVTGDSQLYTNMQYALIQRTVREERIIKDRSHIFSNHEKTQPESDIDLDPTNIVFIQKFLKYANS